MKYVPMRRTVNAIVAVLYVVSISLLIPGKAFAATLNGHTVVQDANGKLLSWVAQQDQAYAKVSQLAWDYLTQKPSSGAKVPNSPTNGKPFYYTQSYMDPDTQQAAGWPNNPAGKNAMLIESALGYYQFSGDADVLAVAKGLADQQLATGMTLATDNWASVPYASGDADSLTYKGASYGNSTGVGDGVGVIEPDKIGELGRQFVQLYKLTGDTRYRDAAVNGATALTCHVRTGTTNQSPWPFRVKALDGAIVEQYTAHTIAPIGLLDDVIALGYTQGTCKDGSTPTYQSARTTAWNWMLTYPMTNNNWSAYFEDVAIKTNPGDNLNQYNAMMTAMYVLQHPDKDPAWQTHVQNLISWVESRFGVMDNGALTIREQNAFYYPMGSHTARYAAVNALLYEKTGNTAAKEKALRSFNWATYMMRSNGVGIDGPQVGNQWFTDSYGDYIRHFMTGMAAVPEFAPVGQTHLLQTSSVIKSIDYTNPNDVVYQTADAGGVEKVKVDRVPTGVNINGIPADQLSNINDPAVPGWTYDATSSVLSIRRTAGTGVVIGLNGPPTNIFPTVNLTAPATVYTAPASFTLTTDAADSDGSITKVEFYQDGAATPSATVTSAPYTYSVQNVTSGTYNFVAKAYDNAGALSSSNTVTVTVNPVQQSGPLTARTPVTTRQTTAGSSITSGSFTAQPGDLVVAFLSSDGPSSGAMSFSTPTTSGLTWTLKKRANANGSGTAEIWTAIVPAGFTSGTLRASRSSGSFQGAVTIVAFAGADLTAVGATGSASGTNKAPSVSVTTTKAGSWVWGVGNDWSSMASRTAGTNQTVVDQYLPSGIGAFWVQKQNAVTALPGSVTINNTTPTNNDKWNLAAIEIVAAQQPSGDIRPPVISGVTSGDFNQNGGSVTWSTDEPATSQVEYGLTTAYGSSTSVNAALEISHSQVVSGLDAGTTYHYRVRSVDAAGNAAVSSDKTFTTPDSTAPNFPSNSVLSIVATSMTTVQVSWPAATDNVAVTGYTVTRAPQNDPEAVVTVASVNAATRNFTDSGLNPGESYVYTILARDAANNLSLPLSGGVALPAPDTQAPSAPANLQSSTTTTSIAISWDASVDNTGVTGYQIWRDGVLHVTVNGTTLSFTDSGLAPEESHTYMVRALDAAGNSSDNSADLVAATTPDLQAPSMPGNLNFSGITTSSLSVSWSPSTDNIAVTSYEVWRTDASGNPVQVATVSPATTNFTDSGLQSGTTYYYFIRALDAHGNYTDSQTLSVVTAVPDTTPPIVLLASPGSTVAGTIVLSATASDASGVSNVQFYDGTTLITTDSSSPYQATWDTIAVANGSHTLRAVATDQFGNTAESSVNVTVNNVASPLAIDKQVTTKQSSASSSISVSGLTTTKANDLLVAFIASDGPNGAQSIKTLTGAGLTWTLRKRVNTSAGTSEIWTAVAPSVLTNATVTATRNTGSYVGFMSVVAFSGADTTVIGAVGGASGNSGAPTANLVTTRANSWVWAVGNDWDGATARTVGSGQTKVDEFLATGIGDSFWLQRQTNQTANSGTTVTMNDTAPTNHRWNWALIEIRAQ